MSKNIDELLKPRYKVIAEYPYCPFEVGQILVQDMDTCGEVWVLKSDVGNRLDKNFISKEKIGLYPHLFQPIPWYAERKVEDMPEYVKFKSAHWRERYGQVCKVVNWYKYPYVCIFHDHHPPEVIEPASEQDYLDYINQKEK